jgi:hypothetical protein
MRFYSERTGGQENLPQFCGLPAFTRPAFQDERGQFIKEDGERTDAVWLGTDEDNADTPVVGQVGTD